MEDSEGIGCGIIGSLIIAAVGIVMLFALWGILSIPEKRQTKLTKRIDKAVTECDFVQAHAYLNELALSYKDNKYDMKNEYYPTVQKVYEAEMRYLISLDTEESWKRASLLPLEVDKTIPEKSNEVSKELKKMYFEYANEFGKTELAEAASGKKLILTSTSISGPLGSFFEVVDKEDGYKLDDSGKMTLEIKRKKKGKIESNSIVVLLLDEDGNMVANDSEYFSSYSELYGLREGESTFVSFEFHYNTNNLYSATRIKVSSKEG